MEYKKMAESTDCVLSRENFISLFTKNCYINNYFYIPDVRVLSCDPVTTGLWMSYQYSNVEDGASILVYIMYENCKEDGILRKMFVRHEIIDCKFLYSLKETLVYFNTMTHLSLENCALQDEDIEFLRALLIHHPNLTHLNIDKNPTERQTYWMLLLQTNVEYLSLARCDLNHKGFVAICNIIEKEDTPLRVLIVSGNVLNDSDASSLAKALRTNRKLSTIFLAENFITDLGCKAIMSSLQKFRLTSKEMVNRKLVHSKETKIRKPHKVPVKVDFQKLSPLVLNEYFEEGKFIYSAGNLKVNHVNFAYNKIGKSSYIYITNVLKYQKEIQNSSLGTGLWQIDIAGNPSDDSLQANKIRSILAKKYFFNKHLYSEPRF